MWFRDENGDGFPSPFEFRNHILVKAYPHTVKAQPQSLLKLNHIMC